MKHRTIALLFLLVLMAVQFSTYGLARAIAAFSRALHQKPATTQFRL